MGSIHSLNYSLSVPSNLSFACPKSTANSVGVLDPLFNANVDNDHLTNGNWIGYLKQSFTSFLTSDQDRKVSKYFIEKFKGILFSEAHVNRKALEDLVNHAEHHISTHQGWFFWRNISTEITRLEHYTLAIRKRFNLISSSQSSQAFFEQCYSHNKSLLSRWCKVGFSEATFWDHPDLVDFIFKSHLHRRINHPYYKHAITMKNRLVRRESQITAISEPHLLFCGRQTPWSEIRKKIHIDVYSQLYSIENGKKKRWTYLENGFTPILNDYFAHPQRLRKLDQAPVGCKLQIITTHAHQKDWNFFDRVLEGTRHSFFRIIPGEGFSVRHPRMCLEQGSVYSFGWGAFWQGVNKSSPLSTLKGKWNSPDHWEFLKEDHCVTTMEITDNQMIKLMEIIRKRSKEEHPFHFITANCCGITANVLNEAGIITLCTKNQMERIGYELFTPKCIRVPLDCFINFINSMTPKFITRSAMSFGALIYSIAFAPLFTLLGAWRTQISYEDETENILTVDRLRVKTTNKFKALFSNLLDLFIPLELDLTKNIYIWQKKQANTTFEKRD